MPNKFAGGIKAASTSVSIDLMVRKKTDNTALTGLVFNTAGNIASYRRQGAARAAISLVTQTVTGAYSSGGFVEVDATNMPGLYRLDVPDAAFAVGVEYVTVSFVSTDGHTYMERFPLETAGAGDLVYADGAIWISSAFGTPGAVSYFNGTKHNPVSNMADAKTLSDNLKLYRYNLRPTISITLLQEHQSRVFLGNYGAYISLNGQDVTDSKFLDAQIDGVGIGNVKIIGCDVYACTIAGFSEINRSSLSGVVTLADGSAYYILDGCFTLADDLSPPAIDFGIASGAKSVNIRHYSGAITISNMGVNDPADTLFFEGNGHLIIDSSCTGGTIWIRGNVNLTGASAFITAGGVINQDARYELSRIVSDSTAFPGANIDTTISSRSTTGIKTNTALTNFEFVLFDETDHITPITGMTVTAQRSINGGAFGACANSVSELSNGVYIIDLDASDLNGKVITLRFTATGADPQLVTLVTEN
jgi:hypothetical protein